MHVRGHVFALDRTSGGSRDGDVGTVHLVKEEVNQRLRSDFEISWAQSDVWVEIDTDGSTLRLLVSAEGASDFTPLDFRSDGLRWFVALQAFLAQRGAERAILLIDEVETHLHYAAQADLIDVLTNQTDVQQVVYTTHSVGALPPDLGCGVRAVVPIVGKQRSRIDNSFWTGGPGYTALLFGVGAETLAFAIPRCLVIAEGASDAVLLPTLLREAMGLQELPYRIAPGLSNTSADRFRALEEEAGRVTYLVDGDAGGLTLCDDLLAVDVEPARVKILEGADWETPEDLLVEEVYFEAVMAELEPYLEPGTTLPTDLLNTKGRAKRVADWASSIGVSPPSKVRVAQRVIDLRTNRDPELSQDSPRSLTTESAASWLREAHGAFCAGLKIEE